MSSDLEQIIADQMAQIERLQAELTKADAEIDRLDAIVGDSPDGFYWERTYDNIRSAWDKWVLAELGTVSPSPLDLEGRPELAELWEAVR